jgi:hypothetical protein
MSLEQMYENADAHEHATVEKIHRACATFMQAHPEYLPSPQNESIMFAAMTAPDLDHLNPTRAADWDEVYATVRNQLEQKCVNSAQQGHLPVSRKNKSNRGARRNSKNRCTAPNAPRKSKQF